MNACLSWQNLEIGTSQQAQVLAGGARRALQQANWWSAANNIYALKLS